ncbi:MULTISPECIES: hypothetical protein [Streptacidiphilus]|uniref:Uncharacterized protein n=1 Tax=Streptacidiphilus cavernicola TaxID=3342716 RepID=A0ABV6UWB9_9ACTN|nr:hypothetical protein [Streptacidiphilus jeojiense]
MRLPNILRRHRPAPLSPELQGLHERAVALRWEIALLPVKGTHRERLELAGLTRRMQELAISEKARAAAANDPGTASAA